MAEKPKITIGSIARQMFPASAQVAQQSRENTARYIDQGQIARAVGSGLVAPLVTYPAAVVEDVVGRPARTVASSLVDVLGGALGSGGSTAVAPAAPAASRQPVAPQRAVEAAMAKGRAAPAVTPQARALAAIDTILRGPFTLKEFETAVGALPAPAKPQTTKNTVLGQTAELSQQIFQNQITQAQELAKSDPESAQAAVAKATDDYFKRNSGLVGFNPADLVNAQILQAGLGGGE